MNKFYERHVGGILTACNKDLRKLGMELKINHKHVKDRLQSRSIDTVDFITALKQLIDHKLCQLIYLTSLERPFYKIDFTYHGVILAIGFEQSDVNTFKIRTVLDPKIHNLHADENHCVACII